jgi:hypothetical protein
MTLPMNIGELTCIKTEIAFLSGRQSFFASDSEHFTTSLISEGGESYIRQEIIYEIGRLCLDGEFTLVNGADATLFRIPVTHEGF